VTDPREAPDEPAEGEAVVPGGVTRPWRGTLGDDETGDALVFLPGQADIQRTLRLLQERGIWRQPAELDVDMREAGHEAVEAYRSDTLSSLLTWSLLALVLALVLAVYIWLVIRPDPELILTGWVATLVVAFYLGSRVARELFYGYDRVRNRRAMEATPPPPGQPRGGARDYASKAAA
jgi:hypothetical protein